MALIEWNESLSVGVKEVDVQHQKLIALINELNDGMKQGKGKDVLGGIISRLSQYTVTHFSYEERQFEKFGYTDAEAHVAEHKKFVAEIGTFEKDFKEGRLGVTLRVMSFLSDWLKNHIQKTDKKYAPTFNQNGLN